MAATIDGTVGVEAPGYTAEGRVVPVRVEGSFVPTLANCTPTYTAREGHYIRIGNLVYINIHIATSAISGASGNLAITGLPFIAAAASSVHALTVGLYANITYGSGRTLLARILGAVGEVTVREGISGGGHVATATSAWGATGQMAVAGCYFTDEAMP